MFDKRKRGQSTVEYIVLVTAVIGVAVAFLLAPNSPFKTNLNSTLSNASTQMGTMANRLVGGQATSNAAASANAATTINPSGNCASNQIPRLQANGSTTCVAI